MEEFNFVDLAVLQRIEPDTVVEKFGSKINSSFFDAANMLGTLKQKGLIDFRSSFPGPSEVLVTEKGKQLLAEAEARSMQGLDKLDEVILGAIAGGSREPKAIGERINLRASDLAFHLNRLVKQNCASYVFKSGRIEFSLTEEGFRRAGYPGAAIIEAESRGESEEVESIIREQPVFEATGPVRLDRAARIRAKAEYYTENWMRYARMVLVLLALITAAGIYWLFLRR